MACVNCPGLPADWVNGWLAAVGATVLDSRIRLHWRADTPIAVLSVKEGDPVAVLTAAWPNTASLQDLPIAEHWGSDTGSLRRKVPVDAFVERVRAARGHRHVWTLSSTMTDLCVDEKGEVAHSSFDPAGPGTIKWLHHRLLKVHKQVEPSRERIMESLAGRAIRIKDNGLGFDHTRLGAQADDAGKWVDPLVEVLAFFGLNILPVRGRGSDQRLDRSRSREIQKGWLTVSGNRGRRFTWPAWHQPLDRAGIDALMDVWRPLSRASWRRMGVHAAWQSVQFRPRGSADSTRAFGSEPL